MRNTVLPDLPPEWTEDDARLALDEWRRSGQTIAAFAREHQMSAPRLYWWRKRLPKDGAAPMTSLVPAKISSWVFLAGGGGRWPRHHRHGRPEPAFGSG